MRSRPRIPGSSSTTSTWNIESVKALLVRRQREQETCATAGARRSLDAPAVGLDDRAADRKSEPRAAGVAFLAAALELGEQAFGVAGWQSRTGVVDDDTHR